MKSLNNFLVNKKVKKDNSGCTIEKLYCWITTNDTINTITDDQWNTLYKYYKTDKKNCKFSSVNEYKDYITNNQSKTFYDFTELKRNDIYYIHCKIDEEHIISLMVYYFDPIKELNIPNKQLL